MSGAGNSASVSGNFFVGGDGDTLGASAGNGLASVSAGAQLTIGASAAAKIGLGNGTGSIGELDVTDAGSQLVLTGLTIAGVNGVGELAAANGATAQSAGLDLADGPGSFGTLLVYNNGTTWTETSAIFDGGLPGNSGGKGLIAVNDGGLLRVYQKLYLAQNGLATVTATLDADPNFPNPPPPAGPVSNGRIFVGSDNFGPDGAIRVGSGGILAGKGKQAGTSVVHTNVVGKVVVGLGGRFQPGGDPDVFSIQGDCDLSDGGAGGGETDFDLAGVATAGTDYDQLIVSGATTLGGTLKLVLLPGYTPRAGDVLTLLQSGSVSGAFTQIDAPGLTVSPVAAPGGLQVTITAVAAEPAPVLTSATAASGGVGQPFVYQITATNDPAGYGAAGLPAGLLVDAATGLISGVPTAAGVSSVTLTSTNVGGTGTAALTLTIASAAVAGSPVITSAGTAAGQVGQPFTYQITATNTPTTFGAAGLPDGLSVDAASGLITGTPTVAGTFVVTLSAGNAVAANNTTLSLTIASNLPTVTLEPKVQLADADSGTPGSFLLTRTGDPSQPLQVTYTIKGKAINGVDYQTLPTTKKFKAGKSTKQIKIRPFPEPGVTGKKAVTLILQPSPDYIVGTTGKVKVKIEYGE